ncbi:MAG: hypothetical protein ACXVMS_03615 [Flavisolibacter sp.]
MRGLPLVIVLIVCLLAACKDKGGKTSLPVQAESKHSTAFNRSVALAMENYYALTEAFVNWDSLKATSLAAALSSKLDSLPLEELKTTSSQSFFLADSLIKTSKKDLSALISSPGMTGKRHALNEVSDHLFGFLRVAKYDQKKVYLQQCPMAFNDSEAGVWVSKEEAIRNPYLGLHHPYYKSGMVECGETKDVVNFTGVK